MKISSQQTKKLFLNENQKFKSLGFSMLLIRLKALNEKNPAQFTLEDCTIAINKFLEKFQAVMAADFEIIAKL